ncbi:pyridoxamine 5'-phosphate oxidase family protein [Rubrivivax sp. A210]|uniref:pyridoxamine 5'-phosphate oxidase family protein n=1 Tax=Rubrivivax sp. A210 TaxID=2772301 RepID=UPI00191A4AEB|nr:pyridoxamine 5'-phosphate oxidase family protein [Rubrivivax sp. A210]
MSARLDDLEAIEAAIWRELESAARIRNHPWRVGVLATIDGDAADARSVVLRDLHTATRTLLIYLDPRSPKARQIAAHPLGTLVMWSATMGWQLRLRAHLTVQASGLEVSSRWARMKMTPGAQDYLSPLPPGSPIAHPNPERGSREHFAVMSVKVLAVDWTEVHAQGHRRAQFDELGRRWVSI